LEKFEKKKFGFNIGVYTGPIHEKLMAENLVLLSH
jgi:hypothetical protein